MATSKLTNAVALSVAISVMMGTDNESGFSNAEVVEKLQKMHASATKVRKSGAKSLTKEQIFNNQLYDRAEELLKNVTEPFGTQWFKENIDFVTSSQKATSIASKMVQRGVIKKLGPVKGKMIYAPIDYIVPEDENEQENE